MYTYGIIALWIVIVIFYFLAVFGRISSFLLDDIPLVEDGCIRNLYQLRQANLLNLSHATQACPNAIWVHLEDSDGRKRTLMIVKPGADAGVTLLFNKDGQLIEIVGDVFHLWSTPHEYIKDAIVTSLILVPLIALILTARSSDGHIVRYGAILSLGTLLAYLSRVPLDPLNPLLLLGVNSIIFSMALMAGIWTAVNIYRKRDMIFIIE
jgi:hypothetical protein